MEPQLWERFKCGLIQTRWTPNHTSRDSPKPDWTTPQVQSGLGSEPHLNWTLASLTSALNILLFLLTFLTSIGLLVYSDDSIDLAMSSDLDLLVICASHVSCLHISMFNISVCYTFPSLLSCNVNDFSGSFSNKDTWIIVLCAWVSVIFHFSQNLTNYWKSK